jgi:hypothetical protein
LLIIIALILKPIAWYIAFKSGIIETGKTMLMWASGITVFLTLVDKMSVASNLPVPALVLTLVLYGVMSFTLLSIAWKVKKAKLSMFLNLLGMIGAFAGVNFTMDFLRGFLPYMSR